jgi:RNA-binding protein
MPKLEITPAERSALRASAHPLKPVVLIGDRGLTDAVLKEIDIHLAAHELIKVRVAGDDREARSAMLDTICNTLSCANIHHLGKTLIIYRPGNKKRKVLPDTENTTRALRKPSEPHIPKKKAAEGKPARKTAAPRKSADIETAAPRARRSAAKAAAPARPAHGIPRRTGSALSLKAGARRGLGPAKR